MAVSHTEDCQAAEAMIGVFVGACLMEVHLWHSLFVPELDDAVEERLKARARRHGRSLEAEARAILEEAAVGVLEQGLREEGATLPHAEKKGFGDLMYERFKDIGLKPR